MNRKEKWHFDLGLNPFGIKKIYFPRSLSYTICRLSFNDPTAVSFPVGTKLMGLRSFHGHSIILRVPEDTICARSHPGYTYISQKVVYIVYFVS